MFGTFGKTEKGGKIKERKITGKGDYFLLFGFAKKMKRNYREYSFLTFGFKRKKKETNTICALKICFQRLRSFQFNVKVSIQTL